MDKNTIDTEEGFINNFIATKSNVAVYMVNGIKLEGVIKHHGEYHIVMRARSEDMLVYKHAIATIVRKTVQKEERV